MDDGRFPFACVFFSYVNHINAETAREAARLIIGAAFKAASFATLHLILVPL